MPSKIVVSARLPIRRGLNESEAAIYLSLSASFFRKLVEQGVMPRPRLVGSRRIWDVEELDLAFKGLPREGGEDGTFGAKCNDSWADYE
jgi:excisionase family DNA binding protein